MQYAEISSLHDELIVPCHFHCTLHYTFGVGGITEYAVAFSSHKIYLSCKNFQRGEIKENAKVQIRFAKLSADACAPTYGSEWAAGADLYSACDCTVPAKGFLSFFPLKTCYVTSVLYNTIRYVGTEKRRRKLEIRIGG